MHSHEVLKLVLKQTGAKKIAADMNISLSMVYKWTESPEDNGTEAGSGANNPLDRVEQLIQSTHDRRIAQWVCERAGGFFIANPESAPAAPSIFPVANDIIQEFADMLGAIASAAADGKITKEEARQIRRRWEDLKSVTEGFVRASEKGDFSELKKGIAEPKL